MPKFKYVALDDQGRKQRGVLEATSMVRARNDLIVRELQIVDVKEKKSLARMELTKKKVKPTDLMNFTRQLAAFLRSGIPILDALRALTEEISSPLLKQVLVDITDALVSGSTMSDAMAAHRDLFPRYYIGILRSAELTGNLDVVLDQLAGYIERDLESRRAVKSALTYPLVIMGMSGFTVVILVGWVLPRFEKFFAGFKAELPLPTRIMLGTSSVVGKFWPMIIGSIFLLLLGRFLALKTELGEDFRDRLFLRLPVIGTIIQYAAVERFCRILGSMLRSGVPIPEAMSAASESCNNRVFARGISQAREQVLRGEGLATPLIGTGLFPNAANQMFRVGEESGSIDTQLVLSADYYAAELQHKVKKLTTLFEPAVILVMGGVVGFVAIALVTAMYGIFNQVNVK